MCTLDEAAVSLSSGIQRSPTLSKTEIDYRTKSADGKVRHPSSKASGTTYGLGMARPKHRRCDRTDIRNRSSRLLCSATSRTGNVDRQDDQRRKRETWPKLGQLISGSVLMAHQTYSPCASGFDLAGCTVLTGSDAGNVPSRPLSSLSCISLSAFCACFGSRHACPWARDRICLP